MTGSGCAATLERGEGLLAEVGIQSCAHHLSFGTTLDARRSRAAATAAAAQREPCHQWYAKHAVRPHRVMLTSEAGSVSVDASFVYLGNFAFGFDRTSQTNWHALVEPDEPGWQPPERMLERSHTSLIRVDVRI